jgi:hypothetical protein
MIGLLEALKDVSLSSLDISSTGCGISTASKLAELLSGATKFSAAIEALAIGANPIGTEGGNILIEAIQSSSLKTIDIGQPLPLHGKYESDTADLADSGMGPGQVVIFAWWLTTDAAAAVVDLNISINPIGVDGAKALGDVISGSSLKCLIIGPKGTRLPVNDGEVTELNFEGQKFSPVEVTLVAAATSTLAALTEVDVRGNKGLDKAAVDALRAAAPETCKILAD